MGYLAKEISLSELEAMEPGSYRLIDVREDASAPEGQEARALLQVRRAVPAGGGDAL